MTGSPKFLGDPNLPFAHALRLRRDGHSRPVMPKHRFQNHRMAPAQGNAKALALKNFEAQSHGFRTGCLRFAGFVTLPDARLASGRWSDATRRDSHPQGHYQRFQIQLHFIIPLRQASWRNPRYFVNSKPKKNSQVFHGPRLIHQSLLFFRLLSAAFR